MSRKRVELYEEPLPDGRCVYRLPYIDKMTGKNRTLSVTMASKSAGNYKLALRTLQTKLDKIMLEADGRNATISELVEIYLGERSRVLKPSTIMRDTSVLNNMIKLLGAETYLSSLTVPYIKKRLTEYTTKPATYNEYIKRFKSFLNWCYINDYIDNQNLSNKLLAMPDDKKMRIAEKFLEKDELQLLLEASTHPLWTLLIKFLALSGMRVGELIGLNNEDIDGDYIHISRTYEVGAKHLSETPKTASSNRDLYLRPELKQATKEIQSYMRKYKFEHGIRSDLFVCGADGSYIHYDAFRKYLGELSERVIGRRITPHALRHTTASLLIADGIPLEVVSRMLGHDGSRITKQIYIHITQELKNRDREILSQAQVL